MRRILRNKLFYLGWVLPFIGFWIAAYFVENRILLEVGNALVMAISVSVGVAYTPALIKVLRNPAYEEMQYLIAGIWLSWWAHAGWRAWSLLWLLSGQPAWLVNSDVVAFFLFSVFCGGAFHLISPNALWKEIPGLRWIALGLVVGFGVIVGMVLIGRRPDLTWLAESIRPYVPR